MQGGKHSIDAGGHQSTVSGNKPELVFLGYRKKQIMKTKSVCSTLLQQLCELLPSLDPCHEFFPWWIVIL